MLTVFSHLSSSRETSDRAGNEQDWGAINPGRTGRQGLPPTMIWKTNLWEAVLVLSKISWFRVVKCDLYLYLSMPQS